METTIGFRGVRVQGSGVWDLGGTLNPKPSGLGLEFRS